MIARFAPRFALLILCALFAACSSFDARWKSAAASSTATRWEGRWTSHQHQTPSGPAGGRLQAVIEPAAEGKLTAHFHANWQIFSSDYTMALNPKGPAPRRGAVREFVGTHELPKMFGGTYRYEARIAGDDFKASYDSSYDTGIFTLRRVVITKDCFPAHPRH
jgi:hypothetical protein